MVANNGRVILKYFPIPESDAITPSVTYKNLEDRINDYIQSLGMEVKVLGLTYPHRYAALLTLWAEH